MSRIAGQRELVLFKHVAVSSDVMSRLLGTDNTQVEPGNNDHFCQTNEEGDYDMTKQ
jgi:hypothetical protein